MHAVVYQENWSVAPTEINAGPLEDMLAYVQVQNLYERFGNEAMRVTTVEQYPLTFCWVEPVEAAQ